MRTKNALYCCAAILVLGVAAAGLAQPALQESPLSGQERGELRDLLRRFDPERPNPQDLPLIQQHWLLNQLRDLDLLSLAPPESETLTVCETIGDPHLEIGDKIHLSRLGSSGNVRMEVVRNEGAPNQTNPWTNPGGGNTIILNPSITGKPVANSSNKKFTPEAVGRARVNPHTGGTPTDHDFFMRRNTRPPTAQCTNPDPLLLTVPEQHPTGDRHGGHAVLN
jgi:hypothetical protein